MACRIELLSVVPTGFVILTLQHSDWKERKITRKYAAFIAVSFLLVLVAAAGLVSTASKNSQAQETRGSEIRGTLRQQVARAKSKGEKTLHLSGLVVMYEEVKGVDEVLNKYDLVVAQLIEERGYLGENDSITSWYRFKILDTISRAPNPPTLLFEPPAELLPIADDELLVPKSGGTVTIDGVTVTLEEHRFPAFSVSNRYLLFLQADRVKKVARPDLGPSGTMIISGDGSLEPIGDAQSLKRGLEKRYGESISEIKRKLEPRNRS